VIRWTQFGDSDIYNNSSAGGWCLTKGEASAINTFVRRADVRATAGLCSILFGPARGVAWLLGF
jgi:hypothetical protein